MSDPAPFVMMTVALPGKTSLQAAARKLGIPLKHIDAAYGVVPLDLDKALYAVRVTAEGARVAKPGSASFADPKIRPFG